MKDLIDANHEREDTGKMKDHESIHIPESPMQTEQGREELYLYSLKKMANLNADKNRIQLTNLYGMKAFLFKGNECFRQFPKNNYALIRMDIYRFKTVNEFCGRHEGDKLLRFIADCFHNYESESTVAGHYRADIFALLVPYQKDQDLIDIVSDINQRIAAYPLPCKILPAFGICKMEENMDISLLSDYADLALQGIKGKVFAYYTFYDKKMRETLLYEKKIENEIAGAIKSGEIKVYIQPKVDMRNRQIIGGEALVRWDHPEDGLIGPNTFVPVLEKSGDIIDLDLYVWEKVLKTLREWKQRGLHLVPISINVSRLHTYQTDFIAILNQLTRAYQISPELIPLEVTESVFTEDSMHIFESIRQLQQDGFRFSMDDFGSGYSSLNMLKEEPVDEVKIDRSFLKDIESRKCQVVVKNVIAMIRELGIDLIAEGVENANQAEFLINYGCTRAQGFYYYKPMPIQEFTKLLEQKQGTCNNK